MQINRYSHLSGSKIKSTVWANDTLELPSGDRYSLCGIGHHLGEYFSAGHYLASVKQDDEWIRCNDTQISESNENESKSLECNVCIYTKIFSHDTPFTPTDEWQNIQARMVPGGLHCQLGSNGQNYARNLNPGGGVHTSPKKVVPSWSTGANAMQLGSEEPLTSFKATAVTNPKKKRIY